MPKRKYIDKKFQDAALKIIQTAADIVADYEKQGFDLTLRQLYYQFVARDILANNERNYKRLASIISDARLAGYIDWKSIVDRTRHVRSNSHWDTPNSIIQSCASQFALDKWVDQAYYVEVWIEKDALVGVISGVCEELDVPYFSCRGYASASSMWRAAERIYSKCKADKEAVILHLGDHDPSGIDMTRDIQDRLNLFLEWYGYDVQVKRIALTIDQIHEYDPPPNPTKLSDSRAADYVTKYGNESWELDALDPSTLSDLVQDKVLDLCDYYLFDERINEQVEARRQIQHIAEHWESVVVYVNGLIDHDSE